MEKAKILIVEDESIIALDIKHSLEYLEYEVLGIVSSGNEVLKIVEENTPNLILMDIDLKSSIDGVEITEKLKKIYDIPIVFLTAYSDERTFQRAKLTEPFGYILKPFDERELYTTIEMALYKHQADKKIKVNEKWLSTILQNIADAVIVCDTYENVIFINELAAELTGWEVDKALNKNLDLIFDLRSGKTNEKIENSVRRVIRERKITHLENDAVLISRDNKQIPIEENTSFIKDEDGSIEGVVLVFRDISERKRTEEILRLSEERYRNMIELSPDAICVHCDGVFIYANAAAIKLVGVPSVNEIIGKTIYSFIHPDYTDTIKERVAKMMAEKSSLPLMEEKFIRYDGSVFEAEVFAGAIFYGEKLVIQAIIRDISERKMIERELLESEEKYRATFENSGTCSAIVDEDNTLVLVNSEFTRIMGYTKEEVEGKMKWVDLVYEEDLPRLIDFNRDRKIGNPDTPGKYEFRARDKQGNIRYMIITIATLPGTNNLIAATLDVTELKLTEQRLNILSYATEQSPVSILIFDKNGIVEYVNPKFLEVSGLNSINLLEQKVSLDNLIRLSENEIHTIWDTVKIGKEWKGEIHYISDSNKDIWELVSVSPIRNPQGDIDHFLLLKEDITEVKRSEKALSESVKKYRTIFQNTETGMIIINNENVILLANDEFIRLVGYTNSAIEGNKNWTDFVFPDDLPKVIDYQRSRRDELDNGQRECDFRLVNKNGDIFYIMCSIAFIPDTNECVIAILDITERKRTELALKESEELFRLMTDTTKDALYRLRYSDLIYDYVSPAFVELTGYTKDEINKIGFTNIIQEFDVLSKDSIASWDLKVDQEKKSEEYLADILIKTKSGELKWLGDHSYIWRDNNHQIIGTVGILTDMSERKRIAKELIEAKEAAERADRLKTDFLAQMSHEIRSPLNTILSFTSLMQEELSGKISDDLALTFEIIENGGRRLTRTIEMILSMSQLQTGTYEVHFRENNIYKDILLPLYKEFLTVSKAKGLEFNLVNETDNLIVPGDTYTLSQLFQNLIDNALKYTKEGIVEIRIFDVDRISLGVSIEDTGIGIAENYLPSLFEPFSQEETGYTRKFEGNGLGLALVKKYANINHVKIDVLSTKGIGTKFTIFFQRNMTSSLN